MINTAFMIDPKAPLWNILYYNSHYIAKALFIIIVHETR